MMMSCTLFVPEHILTCLGFSIVFKVNKTSKYFYDVLHFIVFNEFVDGLNLYFNKENLWQMFNGENMAI